MRLLVLLVLCISSCGFQQEKEMPSEETKTPEVSKKDLKPGKGYEFSGNGKTNDALRFDSIYRFVPASKIELPVVSDELKGGLLNQLKILKGKRALEPNYGNLKLMKSRLGKTIDYLLSDSINVSNLSFHQICGEDSLGNVHFTAYFTPVLNVKEEPDSIFRYPLYQKPSNWSGRLPSRKEIDGDGIFKGKNLELAWTDNILAIYFMQVQGSGVVEFSNGNRSLLAYGGSNGHKYKSLGKYLVYNDYITPEKISLGAIRDWFNTNPDSLETTLYYNPSYVFFRKANKKPSGAVGVPLIAGHSVAVDPKFIPYGSVLLGKVPVLNKSGELLRHEYRILLPQDTGGAIKGAGHIDLYMGMGQKGEELASAMHHYGGVYLINVY